MQYEKKSRTVIMRAADWARELGHSYVGSAHLLLALSEAKAAGVEAEPVLALVKEVFACL